MLPPTTIKTDYHMHSTFSPDGHNSPAELCRQALGLGLTAIAITEHAEWHPAFSRPGFPQLDAYFAAIERCRAEFGPQGLAVHSGVELGNPHQHERVARQLIETHPFEVVISSLHWLRGENIHLAPCFAGHDPYDVYAEYFTELGRLAAFDCDLIAHFDRILWRGMLLGVEFDPWRLEGEIRGAMAAIARHDRALELNTRFLAEPFNWNDDLVTIFRWFREAGGRRVVVNSDSHRAHEISRNQAIGADILRAAGFDLPQALFTVRELAAV